MKNRLIVSVPFNNQEVIGFARFEDYIRAVKSMEKKDRWTWLAIPVFSTYFAKFPKSKDGMRNFGLVEIKVLGTTEEDGCLC